MNISMLPATIYFVGIAAVVAAKPDSNVTRAVIFPETGKATFYNGVQLMPHETTLNLRKVDLANAPSDFCERLGGKYDANSICRVPLSGARLWTRTTQALSEDSNFRKAPSFLNYNRNARNLPQAYSGTDPDYVAARFDITGGTLSGCNRVAQYIVTLNTTSEFELFLEQNDRTARIVLGSGAAVAIENKPLHSMTSSTSSDPTQMSHFGWYYAMNGRYLTSIANSLTGVSVDPIVAPKTAVVGPKACDPVMPVDTFVGTAIASAECSAVFYP